MHDWRTSAVWGIPLGRDGPGLGIMEKWFGNWSVYLPRRRWKGEGWSVWAPSDRSHSAGSNRNAIFHPVNTCHKINADSFAFDPYVGWCLTETDEAVERVDSHWLYCLHPVTSGLAAWPVTSIILSTVEANFGPWRAQIWRWSGVSWWELPLSQPGSGV